MIVLVTFHVKRAREGPLFFCFSRNGSQGSGNWLSNNFEEERDRVGGGFLLLSKHPNSILSPDTKT